MENNTKTITCPNCGANPSNMMNCEYCGSMLIRFAENNITVDDTKYGKTARIIPGLMDALQTNLSLQEAGLDESISVTEITCQGFTYQIVPTSEATFGMKMNNPFESQGCELTFRLPFATRSFDANAAANARLRLALFKEMDCFILFKQINAPDGEYFFINFGADYETAARMLTSIIYELTGDTYYECNTYSIEKEITDINTEGLVDLKENKLSAKAKTILYIIGTIVVFTLWIIISENL